MLPVRPHRTGAGTHRVPTDPHAPGSAPTALEPGRAAYRQTRGHPELGRRRRTIRPKGPGKTSHAVSDAKARNTMTDVKKVVLAYSGGLDTSIILKWLQER